MFRLAEELELQTVVTCDAHYLSHADQDPHEILLCVQTGSYFEDEGRMSLKDFELHVTDPRELISRWGKDHPEAISNSKIIADRCNVELEFGKILIPTFPVPKRRNRKNVSRPTSVAGISMAIWRYRTARCESTLNRGLSR